MNCDYCGLEIRETNGNDDGNRDIYGNVVCGHCLAHCAGCGRPLSLKGLYFLMRAVERGERSEPAVMCPDCALESIVAYTPSGALEAWSARMRAERRRRLAALSSG